MAEITLKCIDCGQEFLFSEGEQKFYREKGLMAPVRCMICRAKEKAKKRDFEQYQTK